MALVYLVPRSSLQIRRYLLLLLFFFFSFGFIRRAEARTTRARDASHARREGYDKYTTRYKRKKITPVLQANPDLTPTSIGDVQTAPGGYARGSLALCHVSRFVRAWLNKPQLYRLLSRYLFVGAGVRGQGDENPGKNTAWYLLEVKNEVWTGAHPGGVTPKEGGGDGEVLWEFHE